MIDPSIVFSNILGGFIALLIALIVLWLEFNRQEKRVSKNWYLSIHNLCTRAIAVESGHLLGMDYEEMAVIGERNRALANQFNSLLADAPLKTDVLLFNAIQNIISNCYFFYYGVEDRERITDNSELAKFNQDIVKFALIAQYHIENNVNMEFNFMETLMEDRENAEEYFREFSD